jgi:hypothetical protein
MLTQEQIEEAVKDAMPDILAGLRKEIGETAIFHAKLTAQDAVQKAVSGWVVDNLVPAILKTLVDSKDSLVAMAPVFAQSMAVEMQKAFIDSIQKKLETSWDRKKIFDALLS